ncbi:DUF6907 domain-containing protein [Streptomyces sp. NPDC001604]|uniref:DUF6907 domain-containing protein n=1 Tax=Streptomyces sp. NPDC001604 TaxID=3364593 RepID=UPI0036A9A8FA
MSTDPRTATVLVLVHQALEIDEPDWCAGTHDAHAQYKVDLAHNGPEQVVAPGGREVLRAFLTQTPFTATDASVGLYVEFADLDGTHTPAEVEQLADGLVEAAARLRALSRDLALVIDRETGR